MFECEVLTSSDLDAMRAHIAHVDHHLDDTTRIDQITQLEALKAAAAATQARLTADLHTSRRRQHADQGLPKEKQGAGVADEVALARREAPSRGNQHLGLALALTREMPNTLAALTAGAISEWRATILVRETAVLSKEHRSEIDAQLADDLTTCGDRTLARKARALAYKLDPASIRRRTRGAVRDRRVTMRPAPDAMACITAIVPAAQGIAAYYALSRHADTARNTGDPRSHAQLMADSLIERLTGQATAPDTPVEVGVIITDQALFNGGDEPAHLTGHGPIPAALARDLIAGTTAGVWLRRLYTHPTTGTLVAMDSRRRCFTGNLRRYLVLRDELCRTPWCDAPVRHIDHITPAAHGGPTSADNAQGLCARCNQNKNLPGWHTEAIPDDSIGAGPHTHPPTVRLTTPTGHTHTHSASPLLHTHTAAGPRAGPAPPATGRPAA